MSAFIIEGGHTLKGVITPQGAKNEALEVICATLLTDKEVIIHNIPDILDVKNLISLLQDLGVKANNLCPNTWAFRADNINLDFARSGEFAKKSASLRGSIMLIGPMLARFGRAVITRPGGDKIGRRRIDTHLLGFERLGATLENTVKGDFFEIKAERLKGKYMLLDEASVTGTANIIMASVLAEGRTTIYNAACEPYIQQLCKMLNSMGAYITGIGSNLLIIEGVEKLTGTTHNIAPDMIETGSFIGLGAMLGDGIRIRNAYPEGLGIIPEIFKKLGITIVIEGKDIFIPRQDHYEITTFMDGTILTLADSPWPGLTPDLLSVLIVVATQARGSVLFHQKMFESRLFFVDRLIDMGAQIILCDPHRAVVVGHDRCRKLRAGRMSSPDIRAGIALLIATMGAQGTSRIENIEQIDRGYQFIDKRLRTLGASIIRESI